MVLRAQKWYDNDDDEERLMHSKSNIIEIMINDEAHEVIKNFLIHLKIDIEVIWNGRKAVSLFFIMFIYWLWFIDYDYVYLLYLL